MDSQRENLIITSVQNGDTELFEHLVQSYQDALFRIVGNLMPRQYMLEDLVQDVFLAAYANIGRFDPEKGKFRTWLYTIARNRAMNARHKHREVEMPEGLEIPDQRTAMDDLMTKEAFAQLDRALSRMKFQDRVIFVLAELEELPDADIASIEDIPLGTVKSRLARARGKLRKALASNRNLSGRSPKVMEQQTKGAT